jgi:hypothetical protein
VAGAVSGKLTPLGGDGYGFSPRRQNSQYHGHNEQDMHVTDDEMAMILGILEQLNDSGHIHDLWGLFSSLHPVVRSSIFSLIWFTRSPSPDFSVTKNCFTSSDRPTALPVRRGTAWIAHESMGGRASIFTYTFYTA